MVLWEFPQNLLGLLLKVLFKFTYAETYKGRKIYRSNYVIWGISLGKFILLGKAHYTEDTIRHEYGHCLQSAMLGPLYLIVVGIPSIVMNIISSILYLAGKPTFAYNYYNRWPESWADALGEVER